MSLLVSFLVLAAPVFVVTLCVVRGIAMLTFAGRTHDDGSAPVALVIDRLAVSRGTESVSVIADLDSAGPEGAVAFVQRLLQQRFHALELVLTARGGIPTELVLAFDIVESGTTAAATIHRSRRDQRVICVVPSVADITAVEALSQAVATASNRLVLPFYGPWQLRSTAVAELAAPWLRNRSLSLVVGTLTTGSAGRSVGGRHNFSVAGGLGSGSALHGVLGALGAGKVGGIVGMFDRESLLRIGGLAGPVEDPATWARTGHLLQVDGRQRQANNDVQLVADDLGSVADCGLGSTSAGALRTEESRTTRISRSAAWLTDRTAALTLVSVIVAVAGAMSGVVAPDVLWVAASAPVVAVATVVLGLVIDERARPAVGTRARLSLLGGAVTAGLWAANGSPLRWTPRHLHRA